MVSWFGGNDDVSLPIQPRLMIASINSGDRSRIEVDVK